MDSMDSDDSSFLDVCASGSVRFHGCHESNGSYRAYLVANVHVENRFGWRVLFGRWYVCQTLDGACRKLEGLNVQSALCSGWFAKTF